MTDRRTALWIAVLSLAACGGEDTPGAGTPAPDRSAQQVLEHEFGPIPHGESRTAVVDVPLPADGGPWIPVGFQRGCTCAKHEFTVISSGGEQRSVAGIGSADPADAVPPGGRLQMRLTIDTIEKEAADLEPAWTPGQIVLQEAGGGARRELVPIRFSFSIHAPLGLRPVAHLDLGEMPRSVRYRQSVEILPRDGHALGLGEPHCLEAVGGGEMRDAPDIGIAIEPRDDGSALLHVEMRPAADRPDGPFAAEVVVPTALPGDYVLRVPVSGTVVPDLRLAPPGWLSFGAFPFDEPRECSVMVTDHDPSRPAGFAVVGIADGDGNDLGAHFEARLEPVAERPRSHTLHLAYRGDLDVRSFRGEVLLAKAPADPPLLRVRFSGFDRK